MLVKLKTKDLPVSKENRRVKESNTARQTSSVEHARSYEEEIEMFNDFQCKMTTV